MKKLFLIAMLAVSTMAYADDYQYLTMCYNNVEKSIVLETVQKITFENGQVVVTTSNGNESFELAQMQRMFFSNTATAVKEVEMETTSEEKVIYDLSGRRVVNPQKGLYIVNGKKVLIK